MKYVVRSLLLSLLFVAALGCDKATPVAPEGTTLTLSASPGQIGLNGSSTITVVGRKANGSPLNPGTEIRLSTDRGTIDPIVQVNSSGVATATLRADGRPGTAAIKAATAEVEVTTNVQIGETAETKPTLIVSASPSTIPVGGTSTITVIARNGDGSSIGAGRSVILTTSLGTLDPERPVTKADGTATAVLRAGQQAGTAKITAVVGSSAPETADVEVKDATLTLTANPASITEEGGTIDLSAVVNTFQGGAVQGARVTFQADRGRLSQSTDSTDSNGVATTRLTLTEGNLSGVDSFKVTATTPSGSGAPLTSTVTILVTEVPD